MGRAALLCLGACLGGCVSSRTEPVAPAERATTGADRPDEKAGSAAAETDAAEKDVEAAAAPASGPEPVQAEPAVEADQGKPAKWDPTASQTFPDRPPPATAAAVPPAEAIAVTAVEEAELAPGWVHGSLAARYRGRTGGGDQDHDLRGVLALDVANPAAPRFSGHLLARVDIDLEGMDGGEIFDDLSDTYDSHTVPRIYLAYADIELDDSPESSPGTFRVGRQADPRLPEVLRIDGVAYSSHPAGDREVEFGLYGGIPVHVYDSSNDGDRAFGTFVEGLPWQGGRARFDWMHIEDEDVLGEGTDDLLALGLWQEVSRGLRFEGLYSHLESDPRDLRLRGFYTSPDALTLVRVGYYQLLETQRALVTELDPFFEQLQQLSPFRQTTFNVSRVLGEHATLDAGIDFRRVVDSGDVGEFNREWERYYATASFLDVGVEGLGMSVTVDLWDDDDRDTSTVGADLSYDSQQDWEAAIGTYYSLYKYQFLELDERDDVRTYYARASHELSASAELELLYEYEDDDFETYHTVRVGAVWRF